MLAIEHLSDGTIASGGSDSQLIIWDPNNGTQLTSLNPTSKAINVIKEISPLVIAIGSSFNTLVFYRVNGSMTPVLINSIDLSTNVGNILSMVIATVTYGSVSSKMLYVACDNSYSYALNITDVNNIASSEVVGSGGINFAIEKSSIIFLFYIT